MKSTRDIYKLIQDSENILIGAGAGLSAAAGMLYTDRAFFDRMFPGYSGKYGLSYTYEAAFFNFPTLEEHYTYWARHIKNIRIDFPAGDVYLKLLDLVKDKNYFVITTNVDGQFEKAGFDREKLFTPQGDYSYFQCSRHCSDDLYSNLDWTINMLEGLGDSDFAGKSENIPYCPHCGELLTANLRKDSYFVEKPWMKKQREYLEFIKSRKGKELLLLELGVGFNTPTIIRLPFEKLAAVNDFTSLIRVNPSDPQLYYKEAAQSSYLVKEGVESFLSPGVSNFVTP